VNAALARDGKLPEQVELTLVGDSKSPGKPTIRRSDHHFSTRLTAADRERINQADDEAKSFKQISWEEYLRPVQQAKRIPMLPAPALSLSASQAFSARGRAQGRPGLPID